MPAQPINYTDAIDIIFGMVNVAWQNANTFFGYAPELRWQGVELPAKPPRDKFWGRVSTQIVTDEQIALANNNGQKLYHAKALLYIQLFSPRTDVDVSNARQFAQYIQSIFLSGGSSDGNVWFTDPRIVELAPTADNYPITVSVNYEYDHLSDQTSAIPVVASMISRGKHYPVEAIDGTRSAFTFKGLPANSNFFLVILGSSVQDDFQQTGEILDFGVIIPAGTKLYAVW